MQEITKRGAALLAISADSRFSHAAFTKAQGFAFPLLSDIHRTVIRAYDVLDERSAAYLALGIGRATGAPAVALCTSGTAATHFHAAVVEAHQDEVPLLACTADRPPELRDVAAPQTIDQTALFGGAVRWFHDPGVPDDGMRAAWRSLAS